MSEIVLRDVLEAAKALPNEDQQKLQIALEKWRNQSQQRAAEEGLMRQLLEDGLLSEIKPPITDFTPYRQRRLIEMQGPPLSETIEEQRYGC